MPLLHIVGITSCNTTFFAGFALISSKNYFFLQLVYGKF
jgi:hypothetical protein